MSTSVWIGVAVLAISTYALRLGGVLVAGRTAHPHAGRTRLVTSAVGALLAALAIGSAVVDDHGFTGVDRLVGVAVGVLLALRRAPLVVTLIAAAVTTATLRLWVNRYL